MFEVGIKRKFWFGYKRFLAKKAFICGYTTLYDSTGMSFEAPMNPYLVIAMPDGTEHYISDIERRDWYSKEIKNGAATPTG